MESWINMQPIFCARVYIHQNLMYEEMFEEPEMMRENPERALPSLKQCPTFFSVSNSDEEDSLVDRIEIRVPSLSGLYHLPSVQNKVRRDMEEYLRGEEKVLEHVVRFSGDLMRIQISWDVVEREERSKVISQIHNLFNYEEISIPCPQLDLQLCCELEDNFNISQTGSILRIIVNKNQKFEVLARILAKALQKCQYQAKEALVSEFFETKVSKMTEAQEFFNNLSRFIPDPDKVTHKLIEKNNQCLIFLSGFPETVKTCKEFLKGILMERKSDISTKDYPISPGDLKALKGSNVLETFKFQYGLESKIKEQVYLVDMEVDKDKTISVIQAPNILSFPKATTVILEEKELNSIQNFSCFQDFIFFPPSENATVLETVSTFIEFYVEKHASVGLLIPKKNTQEFVESLIQIQRRKSSKKIKIFLLDQSHSSQIVTVFKEAVSKSERWVAVEGTKKTIFPERICEEIRQSRMNFIESLVVTLKGEQIQKVTHRYDDQNYDLVHLKTNMSVPVEMAQGKLFFAFGDNFFEIDMNIDPENKNYSFVVLEINLSEMTQRNIFTDKVKKIEKNVFKDPTKTDKTQIEIDKRQYSLELTFPEMDSLEIFWGNIAEILESKKSHATISIAKMDDKNVQELINWAKFNEIETWYDETNTLLFAKGYSEQKIAEFEKLASMNQSKLFGMSPEITYPEFWSYQEENVTLVDVDRSSAEFQNAELRFQGKIKRLQRIQNLVLFQKYFREKRFLSELNKAPIQELTLYHGTRNNPPSKIYLDLEESFNINYAKQGSYGKGIYFAKNSSYSKNYAHPTAQGSQMFECVVLVGTSEVYNGSQILDTNYRDTENNIKYESVTDARSGSIFVVFKNRRAYPLYLITY